MRAIGVLGNVNLDPTLRERYNNLSEWGKTDSLHITRREAHLGRFRKRSERGRDIIVDLERGMVLRHGDVLAPREFATEDEMVVVEIEPEDSMTITVNAKGPVEEQIESALKLGYVVGNQHLVALIDHRTIRIPVEVETSVLTGLIAGIENVEVKFEKIRFEPAESTHAH